jgi:pimeloyl-ACP methyl ester carboxylesterase
MRIQGLVSAPALALLFGLSPCAPLAADSNAAPHLSRARLSTCVLAGEEGSKVDALCGAYEVWENRATRAGRKIGLKVVVLPALSPQPRPDPIFYFGGGPGEAIAEEAGYAAAEPERQERDLVFINQRGTGEPNRLACDLGARPDDPQSYLGDTFPVAAVARCEAELSKHADLTLYGTDTAMDDIDEIRDWLGYGLINISGGSYGTRAAQTYLRRHGENVRTAVLEGVVPMEETLPLSHAAGGQRSLDLLLSWCEKDPACRTKFPNVRAEFALIMDQLAQNPAETELKMPGSDRPVHVHLSRGAIADGVRWMLYTPRTGALLPLLIHRAAEGDFAPLGQAALASRIGMTQTIAMGMYFSVTCSEDVALIDPSTIAARTAGTFLGDYRTRQQIAACAAWPHFTIAPETKSSFRSDVPVLLIVGERDPVTPPAFADLARRLYSRSLLLVVPYGAHSVYSPCVAGVQHDFVDRGGFEGLDTSCVAGSSLVAFALELPKEIHGPLG